MPWNGRYAWHRGVRSVEAGNYEEALYWYEKAERLLPADESQALQPVLNWLRIRVERDNQIRAR
jgi:hypothetical protein